MNKYKLISVYSDNNKSFTIEADSYSYTNTSYIFYKKESNTNDTIIAIVPIDKYILITNDFIDNINIV